MRKKIKIWTGICALLASLVGAGSCCNDPSALVYEYHPVSFDGWNKTDTVTITLPEVTQGGFYQGKIGVRTNASYPYPRIWMGVCQVLHHPDTVLLDTVSCRIVSRSDGGKNGIGLFLSECFLPDCEYQAGQSGIIKIFHIMRREELPGVGEVGLHIQSAQKP